ncbi:MAG: mobile mystery protein A [Candidatus Omnitrophica bacterium]|nr:mobile mystery protein A [Candidatus Omnitrophota bacterium]
MNYWDKKNVRDQLDEKFKVLKSFVGFEPQQGWIKTIREVLGMSSSQLAKKVGIDQSRISRLENSEKLGNLKLSSLQKIAKGLNMHFVYCFVPESTLEDMVREQARRIALKRLKRLDNTMRLEKQGLSEGEKKKALDDMIEKILIDNPKDLWD